jgi:integrase
MNSVIAVRHCRKLACTSSRLPVHLYSHLKMNPDASLIESRQRDKKTHSPFQKVKDSRGHAIRGLWRRNRRFYAQLRVPGKKAATKIPLLDSRGIPLATIVLAREALNTLFKQRRENNLPLLSRTPTLSERAKTYIDWLTNTGAKNPLTIAKEKGTLSLWTQRLGTVRLAHLDRAHLNGFIAWRKQDHQVSNRTVNLDVIALKNCLDHALQEGRITKNPVEGWRPLEHVSPRRPLWSSEQIDSVCQAAKAECENGDLLADYIRFMAYTGTRRNEALDVSWDDVDWERCLVTVRKTKYGRIREVNFNPKLESLLKEMQSRRLPGVKWLFPTPRPRPEADAAAKTLQGSLDTAREVAALPDFCFHDLRHYFISSCVMAGIDYLTIAGWVGHRDGGILIGRVYGHLDNEHSKAMAAKLAL